MNVVADHELFYTSADDGYGPGGWQLKWEVTTAPIPDSWLREQLLAGVRTDLEPAGELAKFPTPGEREALPRRLEHRVLADGRSGIWHGIPAGSDGSGRPGNVAVTAFALSEPEMRGIHAVDFWRSASFPTPFGALEVAATEPPGTPELLPGELADPRRIGEFLLPAYPLPVRVGLLARMLDALDEAVRHGGARLALVVADSDEAANWIAAICAFAPASWSAALTWSTWERAHQLREPTVAALHLVAVPRADLPALARIEASQLIIDSEADVDPELDDPRPDESDQPHWHFARGGKVRAGQWSQVAMQCAADGPRSLALTLTNLRHVTSAHPGGEPARELAWARASASEDSSIAGQYIAAVLNSPDWLLSPDPPRPIAAIEGEADDARRPLGIDEFFATLAQRLERATGETEVVTALTALRALDFLATCELAVDSTQILAALSRCLTGPNGPKTVSRLGKIRSAGLRDDLLNHAPSSDRELLAWLLDHPEQVDQTELTDLVGCAPGVAGIAQAAQSAGQNWLAKTWELIQPTTQWNRPRTGGPSPISLKAREILSAIGIDANTAFLASPVISADRHILAGLSVLALHTTGGTVPDQRPTTAEANLLLGYPHLAQIPGCADVCQFYLPDAFRAAAVVARGGNLAYAKKLLAGALAVLGTAGVSGTAGVPGTAGRTPNIAGTDLGARLDALLREVPETYQSLRASQVIVELLGVSPDAKPATSRRSTWITAGRNR